MAHTISSGSKFGFRALSRLPARLLLMVLLVTTLIMMLGVGGAYVVGVRPAMAHRAGQAVEGPPTYASLPAMDFTLTDGERLRVLTLRVMLELEPSSQARMIEAFGPRIVHTLSPTMAELAPAHLTGTAGARIVKDAIAVAANRELKPLRVRGVLLQQMLIN